jgi:chorismate-pyruvate lyase
MSAAKINPPPRPTARPRGSAVTYPLGEFYAERGLPLPVLAPITPAQMPEPYRSLLVHDSDMTSRLEAFYGSTIHIRLVARHNHRADYFREVVLELDRSHEPVEYGAIRIVLDTFPAEAREEVLREKEPLGRILHNYHIAFTSRPDAFFQMAADEFISESLQLTGRPQLFARRNTLYDVRHQPLAEIIEILTPINRPATGPANTK